MSSPMSRKEALVASSSSTAPSRSSYSSAVTAAIGPVMLVSKLRLKRFLPHTRPRGVSFTEHSTHRNAPRSFSACCAWIVSATSTFRKRKKPSWGGYTIRSSTGCCARAPRAAQRTANPRLRGPIENVILCTKNGCNRNPMAGIALNVTDTHESRQVELQAELGSEVQVGLTPRAFDPPHLSAIRVSLLRSNSSSLTGLRTCTR